MLYNLPMTASLGLYIATMLAFSTALAIAIARLLLFIRDPKSKHTSYEIEHDKPLMIAACTSFALVMILMLGQPL